MENGSTNPPKVEEPQQVFIGTYPASHIHVRDELPDAEGRLAEMAAAFSNGGSIDNVAAWNKDRIASSLMESLREEDVEHDGVASRKSFKLGPPLSKLLRPDLLYQCMPRAFAPILHLSLSSRIKSYLLDLAEIRR